MEVTIQKDQTKAIDSNGKEYNVVGLKIFKDRQPPIIYPTTDNFYLVACPSGTKHRSQLNEDGSLLLL